ncbi:acyltransferase family protein [Billgrantia lactosivorans]|uniref:acyltransferase family protein n=1 Tax=Billgrantia lactosivorans TaxID=2185141 RepID=UPI0013A692D5|nr:acyltransferase family protein [Halomonas lactosivorans]
MDYRRDIDGLRAVAVLPVILFHADLPPFSGGFVGVDVFFVISGYLITLLLIGEIESGRFSLARFYERRAKRLLPALFFVLILCTPLAWLWMLPSQFEEYAQSLMAISFFVSNIHFWKKDDYFAPEAESNPLLHTWSLSLEEQFYIIFPLLLVMIWRYGRKSAFRIVMLLTLASFLLSEWGWRYSPSASFYLLPTRAWELGAGSICAFLAHRSKPSPRAVLPLFGLCLIAYAVVLFDDETPFPSVYTLVPVVGAVLVILFGDGRGLADKFLRSRIMVGIGLISYSAYLWHQPLMALARIRSEAYPSPSTMLALALASLGLAYLTWRYVELPFRRPRRAAGMSGRRVLAYSVAGSLLFASIGLHGRTSDGMRYLWELRYPVASRTYTIIERSMEEADAGPSLVSCQLPSLIYREDKIRYLNGCKLAHGEGILVIGDSHGTDLFNGMVLNGVGDFIVGSVRGGCSPGTERADCQRQYRDIRRLISEHGHLFKSVIYTQAGFYLLERMGDGRKGRRLISRHSLNDSMHRSDYRIKQESILETMDYLEELSTLAVDTEIYWIGPRVEPHIPVNKIVMTGCGGEFEMRSGQEALFEEIGEEIARQAELSPVHYVDQIEAVAFDISRDFINCREWLWRDGDHWSLAGAEEFTRRIFSARFELASRC